MSKNLYDARWTVKAKFDDLYPLLFVMVLGVVWGCGGDNYVLYVFLYQITFSSLQSSSRSTESRLRETYQTYIVYRDHAITK